MAKRTPIDKDEADVSKGLKKNPGKSGNGKHKVGDKVSGNPFAEALKKAKK